MQTSNRQSTIGDAADESENPYEVLPQLNMFTYQMSKMILDVINDGVTVDGENYDYAFNLNDFLLLMKVANLSIKML